MTTFKNPKEMAKTINVADPFEKHPTELGGYDEGIEHYLNTVEPDMLQEGDDVLQGFITDLEYGNLYQDTPQNFKVSPEQRDYFSKKFGDLINTKYDYLKPFYKV